MAQVAAQQDAFAALGVQIIAVSFGTSAWARTWLATTEVDFHIYLDPERIMYQTMGMQRSFWGAWGIKSLLYYGRALLRGKKLQEQRGDTEQLGGNLFIDAEGMIRHVYRSRESTDRPTVSTLLALAKQLT